MFSNTRPLPLGASQQDVFFLCTWVIGSKKIQEDTGLGGGKGGQLRAQQQKIGAIPYYLVISDYEKAFLYVALGQAEQSENTKVFWKSTNVFWQNTNVICKCVRFSKQICVLPKHFRLLVLKIQNNLYLSSNSFITTLQIAILPTLH